MSALKELYLAKSWYPAIRDERSGEGDSYAAELGGLTREAFWKLITTGGVSVADKTALKALASSGLDLDLARSDVNEIKVLVRDSDGAGTPRMYRWATGSTATASDDVLAPTDGGDGRWYAYGGNGPLFKVKSTATSQLDASVIGATTEAAHTGVTLTKEMLGAIGREVRFRALLQVDSDNGADTWRVRVRLGGLAGILLLDSTAYDIAANEMIAIEGALYVLSVGAAGSATMAGEARLLTDGVAATKEGVFSDGAAFATTADLSLVVTGECSTNNAGNKVSLVVLEAEVLS